MMGKWLVFIIKNVNFFNSFTSKLLFSVPSFLLLLMIIFFISGKSDFEDKCIVNNCQ